MKKSQVVSYWVCTQKILLRERERENCTVPEQHPPIIAWLHCSSLASRKTSAVLHVQKKQNKIPGKNREKRQKSEKDIKKQQQQKSTRRGQKQSAKKTMKNKMDKDGRTGRGRQKKRNDGKLSKKKKKVKQRKAIFKKQRERKPFRCK